MEDYDNDVAREKRVENGVVAFAHFLLFLLQLLGLRPLRRNELNLRRALEVVEAKVPASQVEAEQAHHSQQDPQHPERDVERPEFSPLVLALIQNSADAKPDQVRQIVGHHTDAKLDSERTGLLFLQGCDQPTEKYGQRESSGDQRN